MKKLIFLASILMNIPLLIPMKRGREENNGNGHSSKRSTGAVLQQVRNAPMATSQDLTTLKTRFNLSLDVHERMSTAYNIAQVYLEQNNPQQGLQWLEISFNLGNPYAAEQISVIHARQGNQFYSQLYIIFEAFLQAAHRGLPVGELYKNFKESILGQFIDHEAPNKERINEILTRLDSYLDRAATPAEKDFADEMKDHIAILRRTL